MSWPSPKDFEEQERKRRTERDRAEQVLAEVDKAKRDREQSMRKVEEP